MFRPHVHPHLVGLLARGVWVEVHGGGGDQGVEQPDVAAVLRPHMGLYDQAVRARLRRNERSASSGRYSTPRRAVCSAQVKDLRFCFLKVTLIRPGTLSNHQTLPTPELLLRVYMIRS